MPIAAIGANLFGATSEAAAVVFLFTVGELLANAAGRARAGNEALGALVPITALPADGDTAREIAAARLKVGDFVLVRPGDRASADGEMVAGESMSVPKAEGSALGLPGDRRPASDAPHPRPPPSVRAGGMSGHAHSAHGGWRES